ncbi:hypothetical protein A1A1_14734, partial [Planococcus antarcticus DSM 14505]
MFTGARHKCPPICGWPVTVPVSDSNALQFVADTGTCSQAMILRDFSYKSAPLLTLQNDSFSQAKSESANTFSRKEMPICLPGLDTNVLQFVAGPFSSLGRTQMFLNLW